MPGALSKDLRQRVALAYDNGEGSYAELAERFQIGIATVKRWMWRRRDTGDIGTLFANNGPKPVFTTPENLVRKLRFSLKKKPSVRSSATSRGSRASARAFSAGSKT